MHDNSKLTVENSSTVIYGQRYPFRAPYFLYCIGSELGHPVKLGYTQSPSARVQNVQSHSWEDMRLLWAVPGGRATEAALHRRFADRLIRGEWYRDEDLAIATSYVSAVELNRLAPSMKKTTDLLLSRGDWSKLHHYGLCSYTSYECFKHMLSLPAGFREAVEALPLAKARSRIAGAWGRTSLPMAAE